MKINGIQSPSAKTETVSLRLHADEIEQLDAFASAAGCTRSEFVRATLRGRVLELNPLLGALGHVIAIRASALQHGNLSAAELHRLEALVLRLTQCAAPTIRETRSA